MVTLATHLNRISILMKELLKKLGIDLNNGIPDELEERLYEFVAQELTDGDIRRGLMAKSFSDADGNKDKARAIYLRLRVGQLRKQFEAAISEMQTKIHIENEIHEASNPDAGFFSWLRGGKPSRRKLESLLRAKGF